jgi:hypothetical protein
VGRGTPAAAPGGPADDPEPGSFTLGKDVLTVEPDADRLASATG